MTDNDKALVERLRVSELVSRHYAVNMQGAEVADRIEAQAAEIERLREALRDLIEQCWSCEKELTEEYYGTHYSGESLPLCNARAALGETE